MYFYILACECNNHGTLCVPETGKCHCTTKGIIGEHCDRCDLQNHYHGDPSNHGSCFCELLIYFFFKSPTINVKESEHLF